MEPRRDIVVQDVAQYKPEGTVHVSTGLRGAVANRESAFHYARFSVAVILKYIKEQFSIM